MRVALFARLILSPLGLTTLLACASGELPGGEDLAAAGAAGSDTGSGGSTAGSSAAGSGGATAGAAGAEAAGSGGDGGQGGEGGNAGDGGAAGEADAGAGGDAGTGGESGTSGQGGNAGSAGATGQGGASQGGTGTGGAGQGGAGQGGAGADGAGQGGEAGGEPGGSGGFTACATGKTEAEAKVRPVDLIWVVDNSASMKPAVDEVNKGLASFAEGIGKKDLDYKVIMLSLRGTGPMTVTGKTKYPVCIPPPLAGPNCSNSERFFQSSIDIRSTQPLEQLLGTLGQTKGYDVSNSPDPVKDNRGGEGWKDQLREDATKSFIVVTDDNSRLTAQQFLAFQGGTNPYNSKYELPPGILDPSWKGLFQSWVFHGIYGWGSASDPAVLCTFPNNSKPPSSGIVYTDLVTQSQGARAKICDGAAAWEPFFEAVTQVVVDTSKIACEVAIPPPPSGVTEIDPGKVNVSFVSSLGTSQLFQVDGPGGPVDCDPKLGGWYYDNPIAPQQILLCPASCDAANSVVGAGKSGSIEVLFGCNSIKP